METRKDVASPEGGQLENDYCYILLNKVSYVDLDQEERKDYFYIDNIRNSKSPQNLLINYIRDKKNKAYLEVKNEHEATDACAPIPESVQINLYQHETRFVAKIELPKAKVDDLIKRASKNYYSMWHSQTLFNETETDNQNQAAAHALVAACKSITLEIVGADKKWYHFQSIYEYDNQPKKKKSCVIV